MLTEIGVHAKHIHHRAVVTCAGPLTEQGLGGACEVTKSGVSMISGRTILLQHVVTGGDFVCRGASLLFQCRGAVPRCRGSVSGQRPPMRSDSIAKALQEWLSNLEYFPKIIWKTSVAF